MSGANALPGFISSRILNLTAHLTGQSPFSMERLLDALPTRAFRTAPFALAQSGARATAHAPFQVFAAGYGSGDASATVTRPRHVTDIQADHSLEYGAELEADHPGFNDMEYRDRRKAIVDAAKAHEFGTPLPRISYSQSENETWGTVIRTLKQLFPTHACSTYNESFAMLNYPEHEIPQLEDVSTQLASHTGWRLRPVAGLLSPRDFLNGLGFRVFHSTQYIRHYSRPLYTPEPDVCHELIGHVPMLINPAFAELSYTIGESSLGVSEEDINRLATVFWFSVEFGMLKEEGRLKAYGAGLLSSFGELQNCVSGKPEYRPFEPAVTCLQPYPITTYQPVLFVADSFADANAKLQAFSKTMRRIA